MKFQIKTLTKIVLINIIGLIILLLILEACIHFYFINSTDKEILKYASFEQIKKSGLQPRIESHRYLGFIPTVNYEFGENKHNSQGFRGEEITVPKPAGKYRIICIGGSTTYTVRVDNYKLSYPYLLQEELRGNGFNNVEVINAGVISWSSWESFVNFQFRILDFEPDMVIIYHSINDIHPRLVWPPEKYKSDNSGRRVSASKSFPDWAEFIREKSNILRIISVKHGNKMPNIAISHIDKFPTSAYWLKFRRQYESGKYPLGIFRNTPAAKMLQTNRPVYFKRNLEGIADLAIARNIKVILATFAYSDKFENLFINSPEYKKAFSENNEIIKSIALEKDAILFDFANKFPNSKQYYDDGRHVTEEGSRLKAELFAEFLTNIFRQGK